MEHVDNNLGNISIEIDGFSITNDMFDYQIKETDDYILFADKYNPNNTFRVDINPELFDEYLKQSQLPYHRSVKYIGYLQGDDKRYPVYAMPDCYRIGWIYHGDKAYNILKLYLSQDGYKECDCNNLAFTDGEKTIVAKDNFAVGLTYDKKLALEGYYYLNNNDPQLTQIKERPFHAERFIHRRIASLTNI